MASYTALMNIQVDSQQAQLGINNLNKNLTYLSRSSRLTNKSLLQMQQTFLRIENTINQATGNTASFNAKMQQAMNVIKKLRGEVSSLRSQINSLNKATGSAGTSATKATTAFQRFTKTLQQNQYFTSLAVSALAGFVSQRLVGGIIRITDEYTLMENKIKTVTPTVDGVARSMESVYRVAQETRQPLAIVANLYSRIGRNSKELQQNLSALVDITSTVSKAFQLGGATIEESRNAMVQFSQALASGRLQGDELRSILELAPVLATSISKSIGITTGSLRRLASEGLITTEVLIKALLEAGKDIRVEFANFTPTVSQSFETVSNSFIKLIGSNQKFKDANETLGNQLRKFASALDEQGSLANKLGDAYLVVARNVDVLAAALAGLAVVIAGAGIAGLIALLASSPVVASITGLAAIATAVGAYAVSASSAEEETSKLIDSTKSLLKILSDTDMKTLSEKNVADIQADIMGKQAGIQTLISESILKIKEFDEQIKVIEERNRKGRGLNIGDASQYIKEMLGGANPYEEKKLIEERLEMLRDLAKQLGIEYDNIAEAEQEGALKAMLARTKALEMQKRQLKEQQKLEQLDYYSAMGGGASDRSLQDIQFANQAAQKLRQELSKLQMASLNTAFVGMFSVEQLFGGTDPAAAVDSINDKVEEFINLTEGNEAGGIVKFFTDYLGTGGPEGEKAIKEITEKLTKEPFLAKNLRQAMISVWQAAAAEYAIYAAKRKAEEDRYLNDLLKDMRYEYQVMVEEIASSQITLGQYLQEAVTIHNKEKIAIENKLNLEKVLLRLQMEKEERSEDAILAAEQELESRRELYRNQLATKNAEEAINKILQNRETIFQNQSRARAEVSVGGAESYGGATGMEIIGSSLRDVNIEYQMQIDLIDRIYKDNSILANYLKIQEGTLRDQNIQREIALKLENLKLEAARQDQSNVLLAEQIKLEEQGLNSSEVKIKLLLKETELQFDALDAMAQAGILEKEQANALQKSLGQLTLKRIEAEKLAKVQADLEATRPERAVGGAVIEGAQALFSGEFYSKIYDSLVSGGNYLLEGINKIEWSDLGTQIGDGLKNIDWDNLSASFKGGMGDLAGSGLFQGIASAGGASGQRALNIAQAGAAGGPVAALGAAILSNEKVQQALSKLFDAVFEFIYPFLDLLGPVVDIFTAMVKNNPIMTAVNALKPLLTNLGNMLSALASAIESLDLSQQGGTLGYIFGGGLASDLEENIGGTIEGFGKGISGFGDISGGVVETFVRSVEEALGKRYFKVASERIKSGVKDFADVYRDGLDAALNEVVYDTIRHTKSYYFLGIKYYTEVEDEVIARGMTQAEMKNFAKKAVEKTLKQVLEGIDDETEAVLDEAEKLSSETSKSELEKATDSIKNYRGLIESLNVTGAYVSTADRQKLEDFVAAQEEYFAAFTKSEIVTATKDLEESILSFQRMATAPMDQITRGLDSFTNQVTEFQNAIDEVSDPAKKAALQANLTAFKAAFEAVSAATTAQMAQDIDIRGYDLTKEQELTIKYEKEIMDVRAREDLTAQDKVKIINKLIAAREREVAAMEREQELLNLQGTQNALQQILSTFEKTVEGINDLIQSLYDQVQDLLFGEFNLDPYLQKFEMASDTYGTLLEAAFDPDATEDDIKQLQEFVNTYLGTARDLYKSSSTFQQIFSNVLSDLSMLGVQAGFNMPQTAVSGATSEIQDFIDATEDLSEELSGTLNDLIFDLNSLGLAFANQKLDIIQDGLGIPLKITNDMIVVDLDSFKTNIELTNDNFTLDLTKLDLAASFETITFTPNFGEVTEDTGWQEYERSATFTANISNTWDPYAGRAAYSATATFYTETEEDPIKFGWKGYTQTASFTSILTGWDGLVNGGPYSGEATFTTSLATEEGKIAAGFTEYKAEATVSPNFTLGDYTRDVIVYATLKKSFTDLGETVNDSKGFHAGYAALNVVLNGMNLNSYYQYTGYARLNPSLYGMGISSYYQYYGYARLNPSLTGMTTSSNNPTRYFGYATFDASPFITALNNVITDIQNSIFEASRTLTVLYSLASQASSNASYNYSWMSSPFVNAGYMGIASSYSNAESQTDAQYARSLTGAYESLYGSEVPSSFKYIVVARRTDASNWKQIYAYSDLELARSGYESYIASSYFDANKYGFQQGGLVPGPMDTIPAMLAPGEYIMSKGAVETLGVSTLNSLNAGDLSALRQTGDPEVRRLLRELIVAVQTSDTEVNVYTDTKGETKAAINEFRTELRERSRRQGEKYVNVRYV